MNQLRQLIRVLDALHEVTGLYFVWKCSERSWLPLLPEHQRYHCCRYCRAVKESGAAALLGCNRHHAGAAFHLALEKRKPFPLLCPAGVLELVVPVVAGTCRAAIFAGPFLSPEGGRGAGREFAGAYAAMPKQPASAMKQFETLLTALVESFEPESWERKQLPLLPELEFDRMDPRVCAAVRRLHRDFRRPVAFEPLCRELAVSPSHFTHLFKEAVGIGFREYLQRLRVAEARDLVELTDLPIGAVAAECGIPDQSRLARLFQRYWSVTPGALRRRRKFDGV